MDRYILRFPNGSIQQQKGINGTYHHLLSIGVISWIIDTKEGEIWVGNSDSSVVKSKIPSYHDSDLIVND